MKITEINKDNITESVGYLIGLIYPMLKVKTVFNTKFLLGSINHNANMISQEEMMEHYRVVTTLMKNYQITSDVEIRANQLKGQYSLSNKKGFTVMIEMYNMSIGEVQDELTRIVKIIRDSKEMRVKQTFICGCFDGRSSYDKNLGCLSVDVDRDHIRQELIKDIIESMGLSVNLNQRHKTHEKNDQIRILKRSLQQFMEEIDLYSVKRKEILNEALGR